MQSEFGPLEFGNVVLVRFPFTNQTAAKQRPAAGLIKPSAIKPVFATIEQALIIRKLGELLDADKEALHQTIAQVLG